MSATACLSCTARRELASLAWLGRSSELNGRWWLMCSIFRRHEHRAVLLDEVADPSFIVNNKKLLQAHDDGAKLGQSATQLYTYEVFLWRVPIMLTTNNWCLDELTDDQREWVDSNSVAIHVGEPVGRSGLGSAPELQPVRRMWRDTSPNRG